MVRAFQGFTCPECGGSMRCTQTARANLGRAIVRARKCSDCGFRLLTAEVGIQGTKGKSSVLAYDEEQIFARREARRAKAGFHGVASAHPKTPLKIRGSIQTDSRFRKYLCDHEHK